MFFRMFSDQNEASVQFERFIYLQSRVTEKERPFICWFTSHMATMIWC